jgi:signal transduction histidine kinase
MKDRAFTKESICGAHALDTKSYLYIAPIAITLIPLLLTNISDRREATLWMVSSAMAYAVLVIWIALARRALLARRKNSGFSFLSILAVGAIAGFLKGYLTQIFGMYYGLGSISNGSSMLSGLLGVVAWTIIVPFLATFTNSVYRLRSQHQEALDSLVLIEATKFSNQEAIKKVKSTARDQIENELSNLLTVTRQQISDFQHEPIESQFEKISNVLTLSATEIVRPMSHELSLDKFHFDTSFRWRKVLGGSIRNSPFLIWFNSSLIVLGTLFTLLNEKLSILTISIVCVLQFGLVACSIHFAKRLQVRTNGRGLSIVICLDLFITYVSWALLNRFLDGYLFLLPQRLFLNFFWTMMVLVGTGFLSSIFSGKDGDRSSILLAIDESRISNLLLERELQQTKFDIARYLHGNLQSRMMALSLTLDMTKDKSSKHELDSALSIAESLLNSPFAEYVFLEDQSLKEEVSKVVSRWAGLLVVKTNIEDIEDIEESTSGHLKRAVGAVIEEAIANALRHGFAKSVWIRIYEDAPGIVVEVIDDGVGPRAHGAGMGSRLYDSVATKGWSLQFRLEGTGSILELHL